MGVRRFNFIGAPDVVLMVFESFSYGGLKNHEDNIRCAYERAKRLRLF